MEDILRVFEERRSCRNFKSDPVKKEDINRIIRAGTFAPSGMNKQSPIIIAVTNKHIRDELMEQNRQIGGWAESFDPFYGAPVILIVLADKSIRTHIYDGSLVMGNMLNAAAALGLGSIWVHRAKEEFESDYGKGLLRKLGIHGEFEGIGHCAIGYPADEPASAPPRKGDYVYYLP
ncbi:MAG: nitroreductase [Anaerovibrio sp.]|uniref:nitroreductase n=1 Tax=Anaerovibrio sp. TaxID=1872532 RepID=UPI0025EB929D|nr:nitroreductase [Anaerovibrio sp.]MCR5175417.1 nitroreductase [Anaerovibrio sp.]